MYRKIGILDYFDDGGEKFRKYQQKRLLDIMLKDEKKEVEVEEDKERKMNVQKIVTCADKGSV